MTVSGRRRTVTDEQISQIQAAPANLTERELADRLGVTIWAVNYYRRSVTPKKHAARWVWSPDELQYLQDHADESAVQVAHQLKRSLSAVRTKRYSLRLVGALPTTGDAIQAEASKAGKVPARSTALSITLTEDQAERLLALQLATGLRRVPIIRRLIDRATVELVMS